MNEVNANHVDAVHKDEKTKLKMKLKIHIIFSTGGSSQVEKGENYRKGNIDSPAYEDELADEVKNASYMVTDPDDKNYDVLATPPTFSTNEYSPKGFEYLSKRINDYVRKECMNDDIEEVVPCFYIPSISTDNFIPKFFFAAYPPAFLLKSKTKGFEKINDKKGYIAFYSIDEIKTNINPKIKKEYIGKKLQPVKGKLTKNHVKMFALTSYYTYLYLDLFEREQWSSVKIRKKLWSEKEISKAVNTYLDNKKDPPQSSIWRKCFDYITIAFSIPHKALSAFADFFLGYDSHLMNRIYTRILDVIYIVEGGSDNPDTYISKIKDILAKCTENETVSIYDFYNLCGYWEYLRDRKEEESEIERFCKSWRCISVEDLESDNVDVHGKKNPTMNWWSGFGAVLYEKDDKSDYIYCFKGTDFDSIVRDWIIGNLVQGLTGLSPQYIHAINMANKLDKLLNGQQLWFTGHSLGGGLASAATIATKDRIGYTFNAAGLNIIGVKLNQLLNITAYGGIFNPSNSWDRVYPYRIKGEVLDNLQKTLLKGLTLSMLQRGYGKRPMDYNIDPYEPKGWAIMHGVKQFFHDANPFVCGPNHGINNFLYKEVMNKLDIFELIKENNMKEHEVGNVKISFNSKYSTGTGSI